MAKALAAFQKKKDYLVCVGSDGCVMDTMDVKHNRCFGPRMVAEWGLEEYWDILLKRWNEINLYSMSRGVNRFQGLVLVLEEVDEKYKRISGLKDLVEWVENSTELSNESLARAIEEKPYSTALKKALSWSEAVNHAITQLPDDVKRPFDKAREALEYAGEWADIAVVCGSNPEAVLAEWKQHGFLEYADVILTQDTGSKVYCVQELVKKGYRPENVLVCGDAPGDIQAAVKNGVHCFPILVRHEKESWEEFVSDAFPKVLAGEFDGTYQREKVRQFLNHLGDKIE